MKIVIACDSFKGSLTSTEVGDACAIGIKSILPQAETLVVAVGDGGEGTTDALVEGLKGHFVTCNVHGPLGTPVNARYGISGDGKTAIIEMAQASGLTLISPQERNPLITSTFGTGEMIADALRRGCTTVLTGIGGSATNDGGTGMMAALGVKFYDCSDKELTPCGGNLENIARIDASGLMPEAHRAQFIVACDVDNPLFGERGAAYVFAPQKGADPAMVERLDRGLRVYADAITRTIGRDVAMMPGSGAAGGLGAAFAAFLNASLKPGIEMMLNAIHFDEIIKGADLVITGEGRLDSQTVMGKTPAGVLNAASRQHIPVVAIGGGVTDTETLLKAGFTAVLPIVPGPVSLGVAMQADNARQNVTRTVQQIMRLVTLNQ